jgi:hypothetical protein
LILGMMIPICAHQLIELFGSSFGPPTAAIRAEQIHSGVRAAIALFTLFVCVRSLRRSAPPGAPTLVVFAISSVVLLFL